MHHQEKFGTGDINLACSLMALGVIPTLLEPCSLISHENGSVYSRYNFEPVSINGKFVTIEISRLWSRIDSAPMTHPLRVLSDFVRLGGKGRSVKEWLELAIDHFKLPHVRNFDDAESHVLQFPEMPASYCLAFCFNRRTLMELSYRAKQKIYMTNGDARVLIDAKAPKHVKQELINRLNG
jgi:hypothetical protein